MVSAQTHGHPEIWIMGGTAISNYASLALTSFQKGMEHYENRLKEGFPYVKSKFSILISPNIGISYIRFGLIKKIKKFIKKA